MIRTTKCAKCEHIFLSYASNCPECGWTRPRRRKRRTGKVVAIAASVFALAMTLLTANKLRNSKDDLLVGQGPAIPAVSVQPGRAKKTAALASKTTSPQLIKIAGPAHASHTRKLPGLSLDNAEHSGIASLQNP